MKKMRGFEKEVPAAIQSALNRTIKHVETKVGQVVPKLYNITKKEVIGGTDTRYASRGSLNAFVTVRGKRFTLARFLPGGLGSSSKIAKVKIKKAAGYKRVGGDPKVFVQKVTGNTQVMRREGRGRYPVDVMRTIATAQMVENKDVAPIIQKSANAMLAKRVEHEIERRLRRTIR
ncbi:hypothetical protein EHS13_20305 [Paenibacillus psychroresistens]|uniref:HK97 gp10 family phage protein n=2 Tax=Paenibacillus psychroresistens TaxID=1778678 RepID=A0A6B8RMY8_9BACL|nr:hypothetical protein EHS13_20305 [Paenibacillus psychroresistens]